LHSDPPEKIIEARLQLSTDHSPATS
jgi:hypothetical protein